MGSTVVVGYVPTPEGEAAMRKALQEATLRKLPLVVVHSSKGGAREKLQDVNQVRSDIEAYLTEAQSLGISAEFKDLAVGQSPMEDILDVAESTDADVIVIGLRRRSPVGKFVLGSNAQDVLLRAECPVLAVKAPQ